MDTLERPWQAAEAADEVVVKMVETIAKLVPLDEEDLLLVLPAMSHPDARLRAAALRAAIRYEGPRERDALQVIREFMRMGMMDTDQGIAQVARVMALPLSREIDALVQQVVQEVLKRPSHDDSDPSPQVTGALMTCPRSPNTT